MTTLIVSLATGLVARILVTGETATISADGVTIRANGAAVEMIPATVVLDPALVTATVPDGVPRDRLRWVAGDLVALEAPPVIPAPVPKSVKNVQARLALRRAGLLGPVNAWIATQDQEAQDRWEYGVDIYRSDDYIAAAGPALGLTDAQIDDLFRLAATL